MNPEAEMSNFEIIVRFLGFIWMPGAQAWKLQLRLNTDSLADVPAAVEREGYEVCYADLPESVSGFAQVIDGKPVIAVNRAKSPLHQQYTVVHELGHHVLHLNPSPEVPQLDHSDEILTEYQAHMFASSCVLWVKDENERKNLLRENKEPFIFLVSSLFMTAAVILVSLVIFLLSRLFPKPHSHRRQDHG